MSQMKIWGGSSFVEPNAANYWNGSSWAEGNPKRWTGTTWEELLSDSLSVLFFRTYYDSQFYRLNLDTNSLDWTFNDPESEVFWALTVTENYSRVMASNNDYKIRRVNKDTGVASSTQDLFGEKPYSFTSSLLGSPYYYGGCQDGTIAQMRHDTTSVRNWIINEVNGSESVDGIAMSKASDDILYACAGDTVMKVDIPNTTDHWTITYSGASLYDITTAPNDSFICVAGSTGVRKYTTGGGVSWTQTGIGDSKSAIISPDNNYVYVGATNGNVYSLNSSNGSIEWTFTEHTDIVYDVTVSTEGGKVYSGGVDKTIREISASSGIATGKVHVSPNGWVMELDHEGVQK